ncbi:MAG: DUF721 domain-containing protein [Cyanobacteria bacterium P01_D01_bin.1]
MLICHIDISEHQARKKAQQAAERVGSRKAHWNSSTKKTMGLEGLNKLIKGLEDQDSWQSQRQFRLVLQYWPKAVGFAVARQTRPTSIHRSELYVAAATPVWAQTLTYERFKILQKLNRYQPSPIKNIRFSAALWASLAKSNREGVSARDHLQYLSNTGQTAPSLEHPDKHSKHSLTKHSKHPLTKRLKHLPTTPSEAFERWACTVQQMQTSQALCPKCKCRCPQWELDRWSICSLCASKRWQ